MADTLWFICMFVSICAAFLAGVICGTNEAWKKEDEIIDAYKGIAQEAISLVEKYVIGGDSDETD